MNLDQQLVDRVREQVETVLPYIVDLRHHIHSEPEIGVDTIATSAKIRAALSDTSIDVSEPVLSNDVVAELDVGADRCICLRADIDALPVREENDLPYSSLISGVMHACGHDGHAAMLTGAALVLDAMREQLAVNVRFIYQPGEEVTCAGRDMIALGVCDGCEAAYAIHGWPGLPEGVISTKPGPLFAAGSHFEIVVQGRGCHGAMPERGRNPIPPAARIVCGLQDMHNELHPIDGTVVSVCSVQAGSTSNIIPDTAIVLGTARYLNPGRGDELERRIREIVRHAASEAGVDIEIDYGRSYDLPVINTQDGFERVRGIASDHLKWLQAERSSMANEDFAYYLRDREGAMMWLGLGEDYPSLHSPRFDFNDSVLETGILMFSLLALSYKQE